MTIRCNLKTTKIAGGITGIKIPEGFFPFSILSLMFFTLILFTASSAAQMPIVISTIPENNAIDVSPTADIISITFNKPMNTEYRTVSTSNWPRSHNTSYWSEDGMTLYVPLRKDTPYPYPHMPNTKVIIMINPAEYESIQDTQGNMAQEYTLTFWIAGETRVRFTNPAGGATDGSLTLDMISVTFNKPMNTAYRSVSTSNWNSSFVTNYWSDDGMTLYLPRQNIHYPFTPNTRIIIQINRPGYESIRDIGGNLAEEYTLNFLIGPIEYERVEAQPEKGFNWPYLLYVPETTDNFAVLLVEPNNSGQPSDDFAFHEDRAEFRFNVRSPLSYVLKSPLLVPIFPRYIDLYTQALDRNTLMTTRENLVRLDLQLVAMVDDAIERLAAQGITVNQRFFMMGFSASGAFASRFSAIHPERIMAAAIGAPGGWPIAPVAEWLGHDMTYYLGISDLHLLTSRQFNLNEFKQVPLYLYLGDEDDNWDSQDGSTELHFLGKLFQERWVVAEEIYQSIGSPAQFVLYPGIGHIITDYILRDIEDFFNRHRPDILDINSDGRVDLADVIIVLQVLAGLSPAGIRDDYVESGIDISGDNKIGLEEAIYLLQALAKLR